MENKQVPIPKEPLEKADLQTSILQHATRNGTYRNIHPISPMEAAVHHSDIANQKDTQ